MMPYILVGIGGLLGSVIRFGLSSIFPSAVLVVNLSGSFVMGILLAVGRERLGPAWSVFLMPGLLGGFTTYSAFTGEALLMIEKNLYGVLAFYLGMTLIGGLLLGLLGFYLGRTFMPHLS